MTLPTVTAAIASATSQAPNLKETRARFMLYPRNDQDAGALAAQVAADLQSLRAQTEVDTATGNAVVILTLPERIMLHPPEPFEAAYELVQHYQLKAAEPELYTDYFPEKNALPAPGGGIDESVQGWCWAPSDPEINGKPRWALDMLRIPQAWAYSHAQGRPTEGAGIVIAQPDTGVTDHHELHDVPQKGAIDLITGAATAIDPLDYMGNTSHGTGTGSVLLSRSAATVTGAAPAATHMPIRAIHSVVRISQLRVAEAINHAVDNGAHVITMSLGGLPSLFLWMALRRAVDNNVIVLAAAGNCVKTVVWPARYDACIAVAGVNITEQPWRGSCRGGAVAVSAPGENVIKAVSKKDNNETMHDTEQGQGTSFAVAMTAGVAALWLAHHGRDAVIAAAAKENIPVQALFRRLLTATARRPATGWDLANMGAGIVDAEALLMAPLTLGAGQESAETEAPPADSIRNLLLEAGADPALDDDKLDLFGMELANVALEARRGGGAPGDESAAEHASPQLRRSVPPGTVEQLATVRP